MSRASVSLVKIPKTALGQQTVQRMKNAPNIPLITKEVRITLVTRSYFFAPIHWATIEAPAVVKPWTMVLFTISSLCPMPDTAEAMTP